VHCSTPTQLFEQRDRVLIEGVEPTLERHTQVQSVMVWRRGVTVRFDQVHM
jgi:hypothetical protein